MSVGLGTTVRADQPGDRAESQLGRLRRDRNGKAAGPRTSRDSTRPRARILELDRGQVDPKTLGRLQMRSLGLLVLDGLVFLDLECGRAHAGWLIGADDLIRPWQLEENRLTEQIRWRTLTPARIAILDDGFLQRAAARPRLVDQLLERAAQTSQWLLAKSLIISSPRVEERLLLWFALAGERWGRMTADGMLLELPLTHDMLANLIGARRPTVTIALHSLEATGLLHRGSRGWLLRRALDDTVADDSSEARCLRALGLNGDHPTDAAPGGLSLASASAR